MKYLLLALILILSAPALAQNNDIDCETPPQSQMALNECSNRDSQASETKLKEVYDLAIQKLDDTNQDAKKALFIETHKIWEQYKQMNCEVQSGKRANSGSMWPYLVSSCNARLNNSRIQEIKATTYLDQ